MSERCREIREILLEFKNMDSNNLIVTMYKVEDKFNELIEKCIAKKKEEGLHEFKAEELCWEEINPIDTKGIRKALKHDPRIWSEVEDRILDPLIKNMLIVLEECKCE